MKHSKRIIALIILSVISVFGVCGCSDSKSSGEENNPIVDKIDSAAAAMNSSNAATVDIACRDYYSQIVAGMASGIDLSTQQKRNEYLQTASIMDALSATGNSGLVSKLNIMSADRGGKIFVTDDTQYTPDPQKTALLRNPNKAGSLAELYK